MPFEEAAGFGEFLEYMAQIDFFSLLLPFVLSYAVFYMAVSQLKLFEESDKNFKGLVSVVGAFFVAQFIATNEWYQTFFIDYFGYVTIGLIGFLGLFTLLALAGAHPGGDWGPAIAIVAIIVTGVAFLQAGGFGPMDLDTGVAQEIIAFLLETGLIWILVIGGVILWLSRDDSDDDDGIHPLQFLSGNWDANGGGGD